MDNQLTLFEISEQQIIIEDIRTEQQTAKKVAYDVGVKIGGARKDLIKLRKAFEENQSATILNEIEELSTVLAAEIINKNELFKGFSLEREKENGTEPSVARAKQLLIQRVITTPVVDSKESRMQFMKAAQYLLSLLEPIKTIDELYPVLQTVSDHLYKEKFKTSFYERELESILSVLEDFQEDTNEWQELNKKRSMLITRLNEVKDAKALGLSILGEKFSNFFIRRSSYKSTLTNALKIVSWDELLEKKEKKQSGTTGPRKPVWERTLPERPDRIGGAQSPIEKPEDLLTFFGFRGVEFGHYMDDEKGREHLLRSTEAMMDLAELLGMDYQAISLNASLGMAYGARGRGGNSYAHFEPLANVINMTKEKGCLGILAHEWFHALDAQVFTISHSSKNGKIGYASEPDTLGTNIDSYLQFLFYELMDVIKKGNAVSFFENTNKPGDRWRGVSFKTAYRRHNGDLFKAMEEKVASEKESLESNVRFYSSYTHTSNKEIEKLKRKADKAIKTFAQALAWFHEQETGERVDRIPYPSDTSQYFQASIILDKGKKRYWSSNVELAARAFESYIQDKLKDSGRRSDYLVAGTRDGVAFPMGEERKAINSKFDEIIQIIKENKLI